jgi:hypothetical protein
MRKVKSRRAVVKAAPCPRNPSLTRLRIRKVATILVDVTKKIITLRVVTARINDTIKAEIYADFKRGNSISQKILRLPAPRLEAASPKERAIW